MKKKTTVVGITILRLGQVMARTGLSRSTIYSWMQSGTFPKAVNLGMKAIGWVESEIEQWIAERVKNSRDFPIEKQIGKRVTS